MSNLNYHFFCFSILIDKKMSNKIDFQAWKEL